MSYQKVDQTKSSDHRRRVPRTRCSNAQAGPEERESKGVRPMNNVSAAARISCPAYPISAKWRLGNRDFQRVAMIDTRPMAISS